MKFYFDESGSFTIPQTRVSSVGIVCGIALPEKAEADVFNRFDTFVSGLPPSVFDNGEPKGRLLDERCLTAFVDLCASLPDLLICPTILDLTSLCGESYDSTVGKIASKMRSVSLQCLHETMRSETSDLASEIDRMSPTQVLRLVSWARCIARTLQDSLIYHSGGDCTPCWGSLHFEVDAVNNSREEKVFDVLLPGWVAAWSAKTPFHLIEEIHTADHPFVQNWDREDGLDLGKILRPNLHYVTSNQSRGIQIADMAASVIRRAVLGRNSIVYPKELRNYGKLMTRAIRSPEESCGLFCLGRNVTPTETNRTYLGLVGEIRAARKT